MNLRSLLVVSLLCAISLAGVACCKEEAPPPPEPVKVEAPPEEKAPEPSVLRSVTGDVRAAFMPTRKGFELAAIDPGEVVTGEIQECTWTVRVGSREEKVTVRGSGDHPLKGDAGALCRVESKRFAETKWPVEGSVMATVEIQMESRVITGTSIFRIGADLPEPGGLGAAAQGAGWAEVEGSAGALVPGVGYQGHPFKVHPEGEEGGAVEGLFSYGVLPEGDYTACAEPRGRRRCCFPSEVKREGANLTVVKTSCDLGDEDGVCCARTDNQAIEVRFTPADKDKQADLKKLAEELARRLP